MITPEAQNNNDPGVYVVSHRRADTAKTAEGG